jgi:gluconate 2-dehydrogenase gamma chain
MSDDSVISRRDLLKRAGIVGAAAAVPAKLIGAVDSPAAPASAAAPAAAAPAAVPALAGEPGHEPLEALTAGEAEILEAICGRLIPSDALGPGAREARAAHYIDRALAGALSDSRQAYASGLAALDTYARGSRGKPFVELSESDQDSVLIDVETGAATGFKGSSGQFFGMVRNHTWQGTFGDPYYGGNRDFVGWDLIKYPGVRTYVPASMQALDARTTPNHRSAYDDPMFVKATVRLESKGGSDNGD